MPDSTEQAIASASRGDASAIAVLLDRYLPKLRAFVRLRMGPQLRAQESASDLAQSACREVLAHLDRYQYRSEANFRHWLFTTAMRKISDRVEYYHADKRDIDRQVNLTDASRELAGLYADFLTPSADLEMRERVCRLEAAFDRLPETHREVITLARIVGLPHAEIAVAMNRTAAATRMLLSRALAQLAFELEPR